jgi:hypothetical protein
LEDFSHAVAADGALSKKNDQLIAASVADVTQPLLHQRHTRLVRREGPPEEIMEAI